VTGHPPQPSKVLDAGDTLIKMSRPVILMVDDEPANLGTFARAFRKELDVRVAGSAAAALDVLDREPVEIVITDYTMPGMNGVELLQIVADRWPAVHRVSTSGHSDLPELVAAQRCGLITELLPKPVARVLPLRRPKETTGFWSWFTTIDHKRLGILYILYALSFLVIAGIEALIIRIQLMYPLNPHISQPETFVAVFGGPRR